MSEKKPDGHLLGHLMGVPVYATEKLPDIYGPNCHTTTDLWSLGKSITAQSIRDAYSKLAEQTTRDVHSDVCMTEATLAKVIADRLAITPEKVSQMRSGATMGDGEFLFGMRLHVSKTQVGAEFKALLLASVGFDKHTRDPNESCPIKATVYLPPRKVVLLVMEDGRADTVRWN